MTNEVTVHAEWTCVPTAAPEPLRHCATCAQSRRFVSSGRVRLNANGKRLDAWLIYKCSVCDQTWNRPLLDRRSVHQISTTELEAMQQSSPDWVRIHEFDTVSLKAHCAEIAYSKDVSLLKHIHGHWPKPWSKIELRLKPVFPTGLRIERLLCEEWDLSRSQLQELTKAGNLSVYPNTKNALKKPLNEEVVLHVEASGTSREMQIKLQEGLGQAQTEQND